VDELPPLHRRGGAQRGQLIRAGAQAVKLEGGRARLPVVEAIIRAEIPVMGHLGLTPQSVLAMGGFRVQARNSVDAAERPARRGQGPGAAAGCFAFVIEGVPDVVGAAVTEAIDVPTIGIGAGPSCDGQVLVFHDLLGLGKGTPPKFVRQYAEIGGSPPRRWPPSPTTCAAVTSRATPRAITARPSWATPWPEAAGSVRGPPEKSGHRARLA
jgi:ketopantoate hydroxymethyltransferase